LDSVWGEREEGRRGGRMIVFVSGRCDERMVNGRAERERGRRGVGGFGEDNGICLVASLLKRRERERVNCLTVQ
jgi:hypothetical protein